MTRPTRHSRTVGLALAAAVLVLVAITGFAPTAGAQSGQGAKVSIDYVDTSTYPTLTAIVTVASSATEGAKDVDLKVDENGENRNATPTFLEGDELEVVLLVDTSGSMDGEASDGAPMDAARTAAQAFVTQLPPSAQIAVVGFGSTPVLASGLTTDRARLQSAIEGLQSRGETALYDGVELALDQLQPKDRTRRQVVLLSDGGDTASAATLQPTLDRLTANGARLDVVELTTAESNPDALAKLAAAGHGTVAKASDPAGLTPIYDVLARNLSNQYSLVFEAQGHGTTNLKVTVKVDGVSLSSASVPVELPAAAGGSGPESEPPVTVPAPDDSAVVESSWLAGSGALVIGVVCCVIALLLVTSLWVAREPQRRVRLGPARVRPSSPREAVTSAVQRAAAVADRSLERHGRRGWLNAELERAGIALKPGEVLLMTVGAIVVAGLLLTFLWGPIAGLIAAVAAGFGAISIVSGLARRRQRLFADQLGDNLVLMAGTLRTGYAILPALDMVSREAPSPSAEEFRRVVAESRLGRDLNTSLAAMADRVGGDDFTWVAQAIEINREVGGDLSEVLDNVASTIRERARVRRQVRTVTAEGRMSAVVLVALPVVLGAVLWVLNPDYVSELTSGAGLVMLGVGAVLLLIGTFWTRRLVKVKF